LTLTVVLKTLSHCRASVW